MTSYNVSNADFFNWPETKELVDTCKKTGIDARFVGGCVRDALLERTVTDVDLASPTPPEEAMRALQDHGLKVIPTGIEHGTITIVIGDKSFELTTLRRDVDCDGRHAIVAYTDDWESDAKRRDFTVNALYATTHGVIFNYANGLADIKVKKLQFIGDAEQRIKEDALRILRLFRFHAQLGFSVDPSLYELCKKRTRFLGQVSKERIHQEIVKLLATDTPESAWKALYEYGIATKVFDGQLSDRIDVVCQAEEQLKTGKLSAYGRLALLCWLTEEGEAEGLKATLALSNEQAKLVDRVIVCTPHIKVDSSINEQRKWHYLLGSELYTLCVAAAAANVLTGHKERSVEPFARMISDAKQWTPPEFPISGSDLITIGHAPGEQMGETLRKLENDWIESGFALGKEELLSRVALTHTED